MRFAWLFLFSWTIVIGQKIPNDILKPSAYAVFIDTSNTLTFKDIQKQQKWMHGIENVVDPEATYWVKIPLNYTTNEPILLEVITSQTEHVTFYTEDRVIPTGQQLPIESRAIQHKNFVFPVPSRAINDKLFLKIKSSNGVGLLFKLQTEKHFIEYSQKEYLLLGLYYGILILLMLYHLILFFVLKQKVYFFYVLSVLFAGLMSASDDGFGVIYIWPNFKYWSAEIGLFLLPIGYLIAFGAYAQSFLDKRLSLERKWVLRLSIGFLLALGIQVAISDQFFFFSKLYPIPFIGFYLVFIWTLFKRKYKPALWFLVGFSFSLFGLLINQLRLFQIIPGNSFTVYAFNIGIVLEFLSLALSLGFKYKNEQKERVEAQKKQIALLDEKNTAQLKMVEAVSEKEKVTREINESLEVKVKERTEQLNDLINQLRQLNLEYDKENWNLKRNIRSEKESKLFEEKLTLQELRSLYPSNYKCYEFLEQLKWPVNHSYTCPKCGYEKYSVNTKNLGRKCSKCSSQHSVTSNSIFHGQKIDLNKLFYLIYLWNNSEKLDVPFLAEKLKISEVSIYNFIKKLKEKKQQKMKQKTPVTSWTDLIF